MQSTRFACGFVLAVAGVVACGGSVGQAPAPAPASEAAREVYVGAVVGTDAVIAVVASGEDVVAYVCGGARTFATHTRWFVGKRGAPALSSEGWSLGANLSGTVAEGTLTRDGEAPIKWSAGRTADGTMAGLYGVVDEGCRTGVVVTQASSADAPNVQGTWCSSAGARMQVEPVRPFEQGENLFEVSVKVNAEERRLFVAAVTPDAL